MAQKPNNIEETSEQTDKIILDEIEELKKINEANNNPQVLTASDLQLFIKTYRATEIWSNNTFSIGTSDALCMQRTQDESI